MSNTASLVFFATQRTITLSCNACMTLFFKNIVSKISAQRNILNIFFASDSTLTSCLKIAEIFLPPLAFSLSLFTSLSFPRPLLLNREFFFVGLTCTRCPVLPRFQLPLGTSESRPRPQSVFHFRAPVTVFRERPESEILVFVGI